MTEHALIEVREVTKSFPRRGQSPLVVLDRINLGLGTDTFTTIIGASGSGKTTLLQLIAGLQMPTSGAIVVDGVSVQGPGRGRGVVFQEDAIFPWRTVIGNVEYGLALHGMRGDERRRLAREFIGLVGLVGFEDYYPYQLSGGMRKRVALAEVLATRPEVLLLDEPFGSLDYVTRRVLQDLLAEIWQQQRMTTVMVTHDIEEALYLSDRVVVLRDAHVHLNLDVPFGRPRPADLREAHEFVDLKKRLLGEIGLVTQESLLEARIVDGNEMTEKPPSSNLA